MCIRDSRMALIKGPLNQARGKAAAGAIAGDRDARGIPAQLIAVFLHPAQRRVALIVVRGEWFLGGFVVARSHHDGTEFGRHASILRVIHCRTTNEMAAAVRPHHHGARPSIGYALGIVAWGKHASAKSMASEGRGKLRDVHRVPHRAGKVDAGKEAAGAGKGGVGKQMHWQVQNLSLIHI